jgi:hypothetical protein
VKKLLITLLKILISAAIIAYLVYNSMRSDVFPNLVHQQKHWDMLVVAWACCSFAVFLTFFRWWLLVRALGIPFRFADSIRISFWGYLFNLAPLGIVAGDLIKTVMLDHEYPRNRAKALASVLADRVIGLYILFVVASIAIWLTGFYEIPVPKIHSICNLTFLITMVSTVGLAMLMIPGMTYGRVTRMIGRIPRVGPPLESLINAVRMYNRKPLVLVISAIMTLGVHSSFAIGCYFIACGLPGNHLSLADHLVVMPLSSATGVIPLAMGPMEFVLDFFYATLSIPRELHIDAGQGFVVALVYRLITVLIAALGVFYYFGNRREMVEVIHEAEQEKTAGN